MMMPRPNNQPTRRSLFLFPRVESWIPEALLGAVWVTPRARAPQKKAWEGSWEGTMQRGVVCVPAKGGIKACLSSIRLADSCLLCCLLRLVDRPARALGCLVPLGEACCAWFRKYPPCTYIAAGTARRNRKNRATRSTFTT